MGLRFGGILAVLAVTAVAAAAAAERADAGCKNAHAKARTVSTKKAERAVYCLINKIRKKRGLRKLKVRKALRRAARRHSRYENRTNCIAHQCPGERDLSGRLKKAGYPGCRSCDWRAGEVIGWRRNAKSSPRGIVLAWMDSKPHRRDLLNRRWRHMGAGAAWGSPRKQSPKNITAGIYTVNLGYIRR